MSYRMVVAGVIAGVASFTVMAREAPVLQVWALDPLVKVFPDSTAVERAKPEAEAARGEDATFQLVARSEITVKGLAASVSPFRSRTGKSSFPADPPRFVGYVPVDRPTQKPSRDQLRKPPADYPDPLLEVGAMDLQPGRAQPVWVTVHVPEDVKPGTYSATIAFRGTAGDREVTAEKRLSLRVRKARVTQTRLWVTDWYAMQSRHMSISPEPDSEAYYALLERYARNLAEHRHNVALISPLSLARFSVGPDGRLAIDFSRFDRWVETFKRAGVIGRIEGGHIGGRGGDWESQFVVNIRRINDGKVESASADPAAPEADAFYAQYFPALVAHLRDKGWLDCYLQHLADEPIAKNIESYRAMAGLARKYAPELKIIEACHTKDLVGSMDVWVPQLNYLADDFSHYQERQRSGEEVWFYTCVFPQGEYANRFIELPLIKTRLLHWINFKYGISGYLHWGYNHWTDDDPFTHTTRPHGGPPYLPAGDAWIVYPGEDGPLDSIRFEAMRDGIVDHELLSQLAEKKPEKAMDLAETLVHGFSEYNTDVEAFRKTRHQLLKAVSRLADQ